VIIQQIQEKQQVVSLMLIGLIVQNIGISNTLPKGSYKNQLVAIILKEGITCLHFSSLMS